MPYFSQKAAVSAKSGSIRISSKGAPSFSRLTATFLSTSVSSLMDRAPEGSGRGGSGLDLDEAGIVRRRSGRGGAVFRQDIDASPRVGTGGGGSEPGPLLDGDDPAGDAVGHARGQDGRAPLVEDAHGLAVDDAASRGVLGMNPHVLLVRAGEDLLIVVGRMRPGPRLGRDQLERIARVALVRRDPGRDGGNAAEPVRGGIGGNRGRVDLDLPRRRREGM